MPQSSGSFQGIGENNQCHVSWTPRFCLWDHFSVWIQPMITLDTLSQTLDLTYPAKAQSQWGAIFAKLLKRMRHPATCQAADEAMPPLTISCYMYFFFQDPLFFFKKCTFDFCYLFIYLFWLNFILLMHLKNIQINSCFIVTRKQSVLLKKEKLSYCAFDLMM